MSLLYRTLSFVWPVRVKRMHGSHGPLDLVWEYGRLVVNSARANQSFGGLHTVWQHSFRATGIKHRKIDRVLLLGLGTGSVVSILRKELGIAAAIIAVDNDPEMLRLGRDHFGLGNWKDVEVLEDDAFEAIHRINGTFDLIAVDLFVEQDFVQKLLEPQVAIQLVAFLAKGGMLMVNTIDHDQRSRENVRAMDKALREHFGSVERLRPFGDNVVFIAQGTR